MLPVFRKLGFRLSAILVVFFIVAVLAIGLTLYVSWKLQGGAAAINDLGSERMRSYRIAFLLSQVAAEPGRRGELAAAVRQEVDAFERVLEGLDRGDPSRPLLVPGEPEIRSQLREIQSAWSQRIRPRIEDILAAADPAEQARRVAQYRPEVDAFVHRIDSLVRAIERASSGNTALLETLQLGLLALAIAGTIILIYLVFLFVIRPVMSLQEGVQRMEREDFTARVPVESDDEFGDLARGFNRMADHLQDLYATLERRVQDKTQRLEDKNRELAILYDVSTFLNEPADIETLCRGFLEKLMAVFQADGGSVRMADPKTEQIHLYVYQGLDPQFASEERCLRVGECLCGESVQQGQSVVQVFAASPPPDMLYKCRQVGFASVSVFPIRAHKQVLGLFNLYFRRGREFTPQERHMLETLGQHLGIAIENQRLVSRERELAVSEERNLLAQELHDSIAQSLAFLNLQAQMLEQSIKKADCERALEELAQIREGIQESYDDVRELLVHFRLRSGAVDMEEALKSALEKFEGQTGISSRLRASGMGMPLAPEQQLQVLHIVQEALSNVRKHAQATEVRVEMKRGRDYRFDVVDNGQGFDARQVLDKGDGHVGLKIMRERAHRIGGKLEVSSAPGKGTRVTLTLPVAQREAA